MCDMYYLPGVHVSHVDPGVAKVLEVLLAPVAPKDLVGTPVVIPEKKHHTCETSSSSSFCFPWGSPEPHSFGPNFAFFREALAIV